MGYRKIMVNNQEVRYKIGRSYVHFQFENGKGHTADLTDVTGISHDERERGRWKNTTYGMVLPSDIANYLKNI